jgi:predicted HicB family RNase H-like nuclease
MAEPKDNRFQLRIPTDLLKKALRKARSQDLSLAQVIRRFLREWVKESPESEQRDG